MKHRNSRTAPPRPRQRGIVLIFALITLVILLIGAVAISRSLTASQLVLGNIGFKRDLTNQGELAVQTALNAVRATGVLATDATRNANLKSANYSAALLPSNEQGIPIALLSKDEFDKVATATNDIKVQDDGVTRAEIRYVIDRMSTAEGACSSSTCTMANPKVFGGPASPQGGLSPPEQPIFRITLRVTGPRNTLSFFQSTFTAD